MEIADKSSPDLQIRIYDTDHHALNVQNGKIEIVLPARISHSRIQSEVSLAEIAHSGRSLKETRTRGKIFQDNN
jgi:hypothetical protein